MATHWTAAIPREHPIIERRLPNGENYLTDAEWDKYYKKSEELLKLSHTLFEDSIRNTVVKKILRETYPELVATDYPPQNLPLAGERKKCAPEFVTWSAANTILGKELLDFIKEENSPKIQLKVNLIDCSVI